jgi:hypothetical protein
MRQALFAVVLVAASFAGGAVVNGPGLRWFQTVVMNRLGFDHELNDPPTPPPTPATDDPSGGIPASPIPPLVVGPPSSEKPQDETQAKSPNEPRTSIAVKSPNEPKAPVGADSPNEPRTPNEPKDPVAAADLPPFQLSDQKEPAARTAEAARPDPPAAPPDRTAPGREASDAPVSLASLSAPGSDRTDPRHPDPAPEPEPASGATTSGPSADPADWTEVRRALRDLGVSRYGVEGEPAGRVRFHCVIPLAGRRAVGQHFEAEGDDELQAARAALRRVALWRAAEAR